MEGLSEDLSSDWERESRYIVQDTHESGHSYVREDNFKNNDTITTTHPAFVLENLIGKLVYNINKNDGKK